MKATKAMKTKAIEATVSTRRLLLQMLLLLPLLSLFLLLPLMKKRRRALREWYCYSRRWVALG